LRGSRGGFGLFLRIRRRLLIGLISSLGEGLGLMRIGGAGLTVMVADEKAVLYGAFRLHLFDG
jgi:hypothetical protein